MLPRSSRFTRLSIALIAALAAFAGAAGSAQGVVTGEPCGNKLCLEMTRSPSDDLSTFVTRSGYVTYTLKVTSSANSTATKTKLRLDLPTGATVPPSPPLPSNCALETVAGKFGITCTLGSVKPSDPPPPFTFNVQLNALAANAVTTATLSYDARNSDTGNTGGDPTLETVILTDGVEVQNNDGQARSAIPKGIEVKLNTDAAGQGPTADNVRTAFFTLKALNFATTALIKDQVGDLGFVCPEKLRCPGGGWTEASVPGPLGSINPFVFPNVFLVELRYDATTVPSGLTEKNYVMFHMDDDGTLDPPEGISRPCSKNPAPCLVDVDLLKNGDLIAIALGTENIRYR